MEQICQSPLTLFFSLIHPESVTEHCELILKLPVEQTPFNLKTYLIAFGQTCALELPFYFRTLKGFSIAQRFKILVLANLATHPAIYFLFPFIFASVQLSYLSYMAAAEFFAPAVETLLLVYCWKVPAKRAILGIILANLFSWGVGAWLT